MPELAPSVYDSTAINASNLPEDNTHSVYSDCTIRLDLVHVFCDLERYSFFPAMTRKEVHVTVIRK